MDQKTKHKRFAKKMIEALRRDGETRPILYDAQEFELVIGGESSHKLTMNLGNAFDEYHAAPPREREAVLQHFARGVRDVKGEYELPRDFNQARPHLLPWIRPRTEYAFQFTAEMESQDWHRPLGVHLALGLAYDLPRSIAYVNEKLLADWGVTGEEAFRLACDNLRSRSTGPFDSPAPGVFTAPWTDNYAAARLALPDLIKGLKVKGDHVAMAPQRDALIVTGSEDVEGLRVMLLLAEYAYQQPYRVSGVAVRLRQGGWEPFAPDERFPALVGFRSLRLDSLGSAYAAQQEALKQVARGANKGVVVTSFILVSGGGKESRFSSCCWAQDVPALLPRTEKVALVTDGRKKPFQFLAFASWDRVQEVAGELMTRVDVYPERFRVDRFPTDVQLKAIGFDPDLKEFSRPMPWSVLHREGAREPLG